MTSPWHPPIHTLNHFYVTYNVKSNAYTSRCYSMVHGKFKFCVLEHSGILKFFFPLLAVG